MKYGALSWGLQQQNWDVFKFLRQKRLRGEAVNRKLTGKRFLISSAIIQVHFVCQYLVKLASKVLGANIFIGPVMNGQVRQQDLSTA